MRFGGFKAQGIKNIVPSLGFAWVASAGGCTATITETDHGYSFGHRTFVGVIHYYYTTYGLNVARSWQPW